MRGLGGACGGEEDLQDGDGFEEEGEDSDDAEGELLEPLREAEVDLGVDGEGSALAGASGLVLVQGKDDCLWTGKDQRTR